MIYTKQDALNRVLMARTSSLAEEHLTIEYLTTLKIEVEKWTESINEEIFRAMAKRDRLQYTK